MIVDIINQLLLILAHPEEIVLLRDDTQLLLVLRALSSLIQFLLRIKPLTADAIVAAVFIEVYVSVIINLL